MKSYLSKAVILSAALCPVLVFAQTGQAFNTLGTIVNSIGGIVNTLIPIVFALAILAFFWGIFRYVFAHSMDDKKDGRNIMLWSLIAIFIMASLYGIITLAQTTFGVSGTQGTFNTPRVQ